MTLKEAKKILKKEGFHMVLGNLIIYQNGAIREFEKPEVCEAIKVANAYRWTVYLTPIEWDDREARLKKEHEKHANASDKMGMTLKEAKKILEKEGFYFEKATRPCAISESFIEYEDPTICEAMQVINSAGYFVCMEMSCFDERKARLKKELEEHANDSDKMGMTLKEAKDILKKEFAVIGIHKTTEPFEFDESRWIEHEKPSVLEAFRVLSKEGYYVTISGHDYNMREKRLKKEYEENTKAPCPGEEQPKEGNPALKEAASQFNDALLDEQAKKIEELTNDKELIKKASLSQLDDFIEIYNLLTKESQKTKRLGKEIAKLNSIIHDKNAVLSDVAEELRLTKIREKNLAELGLKYVGENDKLKKELADKVVDKIDAQALKSAESALAYKEKVIAEKDKVIAELNEKAKSVNMHRHKELAEKDDVIADLGKELAATKKELEEKTNLVEMVRKGSKEYREYGIAALSMIRKMAKVIVNGGPVSSKVFEEYRRLANGYSFNPQLPNFSEEEEKLEHTKKIRVSSDNAEEGAELYGVIVLCGKDFVDALKNVKDVWQE